MPTHTASSDWTSRPVPEAWGPERLGGYVEAAVSGADGMLFTATPREELDGIGRFQQLKDQAWVGLNREIVAAYNRASGAQRQFAADEVALAIGAAPGTGARVVATALAAAALPGLLEAVSAGMLTERHVMAVLRELDGVSLLLEQRQAIVLIALARFDGHAPGELARLVRRLILLIDLPAARAREQEATAGRRVRCYPDADGQAVLHARGPLAMIAAIKASLEATLAEPADGDGDDRCREEREFDLFVDLLTGSQTPSGWHAHIVVPYSTALGGEVELADVPGFGPLLPSTAHDLLHDAVAFTPVAVDQDGIVFAVGDPLTPAPAPAASRAATPDGVREAILAMGRAPAARSHGAALGTAAYRVPARVQRFLEARDRTCVFPGCHRPARATDTDHRIPWPIGPTDTSNLQCLCRRHHRAKQAVFTVELIDRDYRWTSRGGWQFWRRHQGY
jgi:hypothetical protein